MSTTTEKPKPTPCYCIECGQHFSDDPKLQGRRCPKCSRVPGDPYLARGDWAHREFAMPTRQHFRQ